MAAHAEGVEQLRLDNVHHLMVHSLSRPTATSVAIGRADTRSGLDRIQSTSETKRSCSIHCCSQLIEDILQAAIVRFSVNHVEYHIGPEEVDDVIEKRDASARRKRSPS